MMYMRKLLLSFVMLPSLAFAQAINTPPTVQSFGAISVSGTATLSGGGALAGTFTGSPTLSGAIALSAPVITGGSINGTPIGGSTPSAGAFTMLSATGAATLSGGGTLTGTFAGATTHSGAVAFSSGISFGSTAASATDLSKHIALYGTQYGFNVTSAPAVQTLVGGTVIITAYTTGIAVTGTLASTGAATLASNSGDVLTGNATAIGATAVTGYFHFPKQSAAPTATPTNTGVACAWNTASHAINCYDGASWYHLTGVSGAG